MRLLKDVKRRFLAYSFPPRSPDPPHLAVLERPGFVRAAPALPATTRIRLPSATATCCDKPQAKVSHLHSDQQRLTAQYKSVAHPSDCRTSDGVGSSRRREPDFSTTRFQ